MTAESEVRDRQRKGASRAWTCTDPCVVEQHKWVHIPKRVQSALSFDVQCPNQPVESRSFSAWHHALHRPTHGHDYLLLLSGQKTTFLGMRQPQLSETLAKFGRTCDVVRARTKCCKARFVMNVFRLVRF